MTFTNWLNDHHAAKRMSIFWTIIPFFCLVVDARMAGGCRSAWQECALVVSLEMFNLLLERCNAMLKEQLETAATTSLANSRLLGEDLQIILPAIKVQSNHSKQNVSRLPSQF